MKAKEIIDKYILIFISVDSSLKLSIVKQKAKQCALLEVESLMEMSKKFFYDYGIGYMGKTYTPDHTTWKHYKNLEQLKQDIIND